MRPSLRRVFSCALTAVVLTASALTATASPATASTYGAITNSSWAYIDSRNPASSFLNQPGDAPVGAWLDAENQYHTSRSYFSFDLTPFLGKRIVDASVSGSETRVPDCGKRAVALWLTDDFTDSTTWRNPPAERQHLGTRGPETGCPIARMYWDAAEAIRQAVAVGQSRVTLALRVPEGQEHALPYGRYFAPALSLSITYNTAPGVPTNLRTGSQATPCSTDAPGTYLRSGEHRLYAHVTDPDPAAGGNDSVLGRFAIWPVDAPDQRRELTSVAGPVPGDRNVTVPADLAVHGRTYAWQVQADDGADVSPWSQTCYFIYDTVAPAAAPAVSSVDYPENEWGGGAGIPGTFTFSANSDTDVVGFYYRIWSRSGVTSYVAADRAGGSAEVVVTPEREGFDAIYVESVDSAGNRSPERAYEFRVVDTAPIVVGPRISPVGVPAEFTFSPQMPDSVEYLYWFDNGQPTVVAADSDGTARVSITQPLGAYLLHVRSRTSTGLLSSVYTTVFAVVDEA